MRKPIPLKTKAIDLLTTDRACDRSIAARRGLLLRLEPRPEGVRKTFRFRYTRDGKNNVVTLGEYKRQLTIAEVEALHGRCRQTVQAGGDPRPVIEAFHRERIPLEARPVGGPTVRDVCNEFITHYAMKKRKHPDDARELLEKNVLPKLGDFPASSIRKRDIQLVLDGIVERGAPVTANRVQSLLKQAFSVAADRDLIETVPTFPRAKAGGEEKPRTTVLSDDELHTLWLGLDKLAPPARPDGVFPRGKISRPLALALKLIIISGQRRGEVSNARWADFSPFVPASKGKGRKPAKKETRWLWRIGTNKSERPHLVPLPVIANPILDELRTITGGAELLLPSSRTGKANEERDASISKAARRVRVALEMQEWRPHDLRRTVRTNMARLGVSEEVAERVLNHAPANPMVAVYNQHAYLEEMREAFDKWGVQLGKIIHQRAPR